MARLARIVIPGCPHHVTQRGNNHQAVFFSDSDRDFYLERMRKFFKIYGVQTEGYALLTNHTHNAAIPENKWSLAKGFGKLHNDFSRWQNFKKDLTGHLWQSRFFSCPLDEDHFWKALRYIELNPVRAGIVKLPWDWPWSSAQSHVQGFDRTGLLDMHLWKSRFDGPKWRDFLEQGMEADELDRIRTATKVGRPLGSEEFINKIEELTGRSIKPRKPGRKRNPLK